jgi:hypothetical protein
MAGQFWYWETIFFLPLIKKIAPLSIKPEVRDVMSSDNAAVQFLFHLTSCAVSSAPVEFAAGQYKTSQLCLKKQKLLLKTF